MEKFEVHIFKVIATGNIIVEAKTESEARDIALHEKNKINYTYCDIIKHLAINVK